MFWSLSFIILFIVATVAISPLMKRNSTQVVSPITQSVVQTKEAVEKTTFFIPKSPTIEQIFNSDHSWTATISAQRKRVLIATGDIIPARVVNIQATKYRNFKWPYERTADILRDADITFINLETPLIKACPLVNDGMKFCGDEKNIEGLVFAGVDVASLANNHTGNYGTDAVASTASLLSSNGILVTGIDGPVYKRSLRAYALKDIRGLRLAFLGYNDISKIQPGVSNAEENKIQREIAQAKQNADIVIVTFHWGSEYRSQPDERQKYLGKFSIDAGADLVIGNHPHWIQPIEIYKGKLITYAHGNFVFDQEWSLKTKQGVVGKYTFYDDKLVDVEYLPVQIENYGQPYFLTGDKKRVILDEMKAESLKLSSSPNP